MMDYCVSLGNREYKVKIDRGRLTVDGEPLDVTLTPLNDGGMQLLRSNQQTLELLFSPQDPMNYQVLVDGHIVHAQVRPQGNSRRVHKKQGQEGDLSAPMPGMVVDIHVGEGEKVQKGQLLAVVESMKMQMQMRSAVDGLVTRIPVKPGDQVQKGQLLVQVKP